MVGFKLKLFAISGLAASTVVAQDVAADLQKIYKGKLGFIIEAIPGYGQNTIVGWLNSMSPAGQFPNVDYTSGCPARRANWPAQVHWNQIRAVAAAYKDLLPRTSTLTQKPPRQFMNNATVKAYVDQGMNWWFANDFTEPTCIDKGGVAGSNCPCGTPGMWNTNWYSNTILIPRLAGHTCMIMNTNITAAQRQSCITIGERAYAKFDADLNGLGHLTGANTLDVASNSVDMGLLKFFGNLTGGEAIVADSYRRAHSELVIRTANKADGIRPDGSFGQHEGILYNGNYGKDFTNLVIQLELPATGTQYAANSTSMNAFALHVDGFQWMIYKNTQTQVLHWDFSTLGRMITFPVADSQATESINVNLTDIKRLGQEWNSYLISNAATNLLKNSTTANAGDLVGTRMFYSNDYLVNRGSNYVTTVKMLSSRTGNTECVNNQNPLGFHLGQGNTYTYIKGTEYEDIAAAWDWNLIPGITTDYAATPLECTTTQTTGLETFVGGAANAKGLGIAVMKYTNPLTKQLSYQKAWFFFDGGVQHVTVSGISSTSGRDVYSVLDQKRLTGAVHVNSSPVTGTGQKNFTGPIDSLWHDGMGYTFGNRNGQNPAPGLTVSIDNKSGAWSAIGTSTEPPTTVTMFSAWIKHNPAQLAQPIEYSIYPGTPNSKEFVAKSRDRIVGSVKNDADSAAVVDGKKKIIMVAFWKPGEVTVPLSKFCNSTGDLVITSDQGTVIILDLENSELTIADPTQTRKAINLTITKKGGQDESWLKIQWDASGNSRKVQAVMPRGEGLGRSIVINLAAPKTAKRDSKHGGRHNKPHHHRMIGHVAS
ncbi:hypothetical protein FRC03_001111 [Tulasnella sp. 419]|nr:hypothetical protein FRC03_001111 [Tulasnella sp. 419]